MPATVTRPFGGIEGARSLAQAIVDTVREPLLVLDADLRVVLASRSFYLLFGVNRQDVQGRPLYALGDGQFDIAALRLLLGRIVPHDAVMDGFEVDQEFPGIGRRTLLLNARQVFEEGDAEPALLLAFEDVTERRAAERERLRLLERAEELLRQKDLLLSELRHRVVNSLQIIASILMLKARSVTSEESRLHLHDAHRRVVSVAAVQEHLQASGLGDLIEIGPYLSKLCATLAASMIGDTRPVSLRVQAEAGTAASDQAVSLGLIVTELVINALKHAFPGDKPDGRVLVGYETDGTDWRLVVSDNGAGKPDGTAAPAHIGLGTSLIDALSRQLGADVDVASGPGGVTVSVTHATFTARQPLAA